MDDPKKYEAEIYSYEQLADKTQGIYQPSLDIYYTKQADAGKEFMHTVKLEVPESEEEGAPLVPIGQRQGGGLGGRRDFHGDGRGTERGCLRYSDGSGNSDGQLDE